MMERPKKKILFWLSKTFFFLIGILASCSTEFFFTNRFYETVKDYEIARAIVKGLSRSMSMFKPGIFVFLLNRYFCAGKHEATVAQRNPERTGDLLQDSQSVFG